MLAGRKGNSMVAWKDALRVAELADGWACSMVDVLVEPTVEMTVAYLAVEMAGKKARPQVDEKVA